MIVRAVQFWGVDLSIFQFDYDLTWAVVLLNADKTIYGRYGSRDDLKDAAKHVSVEGLRKAMEGALAIHAGYPANKKELAAKTGPKPTWSTVDQIPENRGKPNIRLADGSRGGCAHCHNAHDAVLWTLRGARQAIPEKLVYYFPMPDALGFSLDPKERAKVSAVKAGTAAEKAGLQPGDEIVKMEGQPVISIADVQWVLQQAKDGAAVKLEVSRGGKTETVSLDLAGGWRAKTSFTWREWTWSIRHRLLGTEPLEVVPDDERKRLGIANGDMALRVKGLPPDWVKNKNASAAQFQKGDVIVEIDGKNDFRTEGEVLAYLMIKKAPGSAADLSVLRGGKKQKIALKIP